MTFVLAAALCAACGDKDGKAFNGTLTFGVMVPGHSDFGGYSILVENGFLTAVKAINDAGGIRGGMKVESREVENIASYKVLLEGETDPSLGYEVEATAAMMRNVDLPVFVGPFHWPDRDDAQDFCSVNEYVCISGSSADVRTWGNRQKNGFSFSTADTYPGWFLGTVYDMQKSGHKSFLMASNWVNNLPEEAIKALDMQLMKLYLPSIDPEHDDWGKTPWNTYATQIIASGASAIILAGSPEVNTTVFTKMKDLGFNKPETVWIGDEQSLENFATEVGPVIARGVRKVARYIVTDYASSAHNTYLQQFRALTNDTPEDVFEDQIYVATLLGLYAAHATDSNDGAAIRQKLVEISSPPGEKIPASSVSTILAKISAGEELDIEGLGVPFDFSLDGTLAGKTLGDAFRQECCGHEAKPKSSTHPIPGADVLKDLEAGE